MGDPGEWERRITLRDGRMVVVRPIRPEDEALYGTFLAAVTPEDARMRFLAPVGQLSHSLIEYFTHLDYARAMAFVALDEATGELLAVVRLHNNAANDSAEYAIVVRSDYKGRGLGWQLMQMMIAYGRKRGLRSIEGKVLHENKAMLDMCRQFGFEIAIDRIEGKFKVGQNRPIEDQLSVADELARSPNAVGRELGKLIRAHQTPAHR